MVTRIIHEALRVDRHLHFIDGFLIYLATWVITTGLIVPVVVVILCGLLKEVWDHKTKGAFDIIDFAATALGGILGLGLIIKLTSV